MIFHYPQRKIENLIPDLKFNSQTIERVSEFNFLGLTIDECLSWKPHVQKVSNKVSRTICTLRRLKNFLPAHVLRTLYNTLILPHFNYSIALWGLKMGRLKRLQKRAIRVITCSNCNAHTEPLLKKLNLLSLRDILTMNILKTYCNLKNDKLPVYVTHMFSTFYRAHGHDTRLDMILDEPHSQTAGGELCIRHLLPKTINNFDPGLIAMVVSHS